MSKKKVLFITPSLCQGGIEHSLITMLKLIDKTKYDLTLFTYRKDMSLLPLVPKGVPFGISQIYTKSRSKRSNLYYGTRTKKN